MFAFAVVIGFFIGFFGLRLWKPIFFLAGVLITIGVVLILFYSTFLVDV